MNENSELLSIQAYGNTPDIDRLLGFEQSADDVTALLEQLEIENADVSDFSNGGTTAMHITIKPLVTCKHQARAADPPHLNATQYNLAASEMPPPPLKAAYLKADPYPKRLQR